MTYALVTGASGGIGLSLAKSLAKRKHNLLLVARSADKLNEAKAGLQKDFNVKVECFCCDLSRQGAAQSVYQWATQNAYPVNILINNAGYGIWGRVDSTELAQLKEMIMVNTSALVDLCHVFLPELKKHPQSYILNVASTAAYQAVPTLTAYAASKAFVVLFTRGLRAELKKSNVSVSCLSPGSTATGFMDRAGMEKLKKRAERFSMLPGLVAEAGIRGMLGKKAEIIPGFTNWLSVQLTYLVPKRLTEAIAESLYKTK